MTTNLNNQKEPDKYSVVGLDVMKVLIIRPSIVAEVYKPTDQHLLLAHSAKHEQMP